MTTPCPLRSSSRASSTTCFCAPWKARSLMRNSTRIRRFLPGAGFHPAVAPDFEGQQVPELLRVEAVVALPAFAEVAHRARDGVRIEDAGLTDARRVQVLV